MHGTSVNIYSIHSYKQQIFLSNIFCGSLYIMDGCNLLQKSIFKYYLPPTFPAHMMGKEMTTTIIASIQREYEWYECSSHRYTDIPKTPWENIVRPFILSKVKFLDRLQFWSCEQLSSSLFSKALSLPSWILFSVP